MENYITEKEVWKDIEGYEGLYQVSNLGRIRSLGYGNTKIMKPVPTSQRYRQVGLYKDGKRKFYLVHRLVAMAFLDNPKKLSTVNHIDGNRSNNVVSNLEWCTIAENNNSIKRRSGTAVLQKNLDGTIVNRYRSFSEAARQNGFRMEGISKCSKGILKTYKGFIWEKA